MNLYMYKIKRKSSYNIIELNNNTFLIYNIFKNILKKLLQKWEIYIRRKHKNQ